MTPEPETVRESICVVYIKCVVACHGGHRKLIQFFFLIYLFYFIIYFWLRWVFVPACGLSLVAESGCYSSLWCAGFSLLWLVFVTEHRLQACGLQ